THPSAPDAARARAEARLRGRGVWNPGTARRRRRPTARAVARSAPRLMRGDHRFAHALETGAQPVTAHALQADARTFEQQKKFVRQHLRLGEAGGRAQLDEPFALGLLERLD